MTQFFNRSSCMYFIVSGAEGTRHKMNSTVLFCFLTCIHPTNIRTTGQLVSEGRPRGEKLGVVLSLSFLPSYHSLWKYLANKEKQQESESLGEGSLIIYVS